MEESRVEPAALVTPALILIVNLLACLGDAYLRLREFSVALGLIMLLAAARVSLRACLASPSFSVYLATVHFLMFPLVVHTIFSDFWKIALGGYAIIGGALLVLMALIAERRQMRKD